jgi:hypothetical protein
MSLGHACIHGGLAVCTCDNSVPSDAICARVPTNIVSYPHKLASLTFRGNVGLSYSVHNSTCASKAIRVEGVLFRREELVFRGFLQIYTGGWLDWDLTASIVCLHISP